MSSCIHMSMNEQVRQYDRSFTSFCLHLFFAAGLSDELDWLALATNGVIKVCSGMSSHPHHIHMSKRTELLSCDWLSSCLCYQAAEQMKLRNWFPLSEGHPGKNIKLAQVTLKTYPVRFNLTLFCPTSRFDESQHSNAALTCTFDERTSGSTCDVFTSQNLQCLAIDSLYAAANKNR